MVLKQADALQFIQSFPLDMSHPWDLIIWDPPYLTSYGVGRLYSYDTRAGRSYRPKQTTWHPTQTPPESFKLNQDYLNQVLSEIKTRTQKYVLLDFFNTIKPDATDFFIWFKGAYGHMNGRKVSNNAEFINIYDSLPNIKERNQIFRVINYHPKNNQFLQSRKPFEKPLFLYQSLFNHFHPTHILDPFSGSFNSSKIAYQMHIPIDACDLYTSPPTPSQLTSQTSLMDLL